MLLATISNPGQQMRQQAEDAQSIYDGINRNFGSLASETTMIQEKLARLEREIFPFIRWINAVYPELPEEFKTVTEVAKRMESRSMYDETSEVAL